LIIVPDAGPLIYLGGAGHLELLRTLYAEVVVPRIVVDEIVIAGAGLTGAREVAAATWIRVEEVAPVRRFFAWRVSSLRHHLLAAHEVCAREAMARPRAPAAPPEVQPRSRPRPPAPRPQPSSVASAVAPASACE